MRGVIVRSHGLAAIGFVLAALTGVSWSAGAESQCPVAPPALKQNVGVVTPLASTWYSVGTLSPSDPETHWFLSSDAAGMTLWGNGCRSGWGCSSDGLFSHCPFEPESDPDFPIEAIEISSGSMAPVPFVLEWCNSPSPSCLPS